MSVNMCPIHYDNFREGMGNRLFPPVVTSSSKQKPVENRTKEGRKLSSWYPVIAFECSLSLSLPVI